jgi:inosine-uridine nucleoside N-ribohydrolase
MTDLEGGGRQIIIDTDPGVDDMVAIFLALRSPEVQVMALTAVAGNVPLEVTQLNALRALEIAGRTDIPVAAGASRPLQRHLVTAPAVHGTNGLSDVEFPAPKTRPVAESGPQLIRRMVAAAPGRVSIVAIGPLTNVALALRADPQLASQIRDITIMGGSLSGGNITPAAEFNSYVDPEAARIVYDSGASITMVGLDVTRRAVLNEERVSALEASGDAPARAAARIMRATLHRVGLTGANGGRLLVHDAIAIAALIDPSILTTQELRVEIETDGRLTAGETVGYRKAPMRHSAPLLDAPPSYELGPFRPNAKVAQDIDSERFLNLLIGRLTRSA